MYICKPHSQDWERFGSKVRGQSSDCDCAAQGGVRRQWQGDSNAGWDGGREYQDRKQWQRCQCYPCWQDCQAWPHREDWGFPYDHWQAWAGSDHWPARDQREQGSWSCRRWWWQWWWQWCLIISSHVPEGHPEARGWKVCHEVQDSLFDHQICRWTSQKVSQGGLRQNPINTELKS